MKQRKSNLELLRIIAMCGIVALHYTGQELGSAVSNYVFPSFSWFFVQTANSLFAPLVNCFVLISGYFLIHKTVFSLKKSAELFAITIFYGAVSYLIAYAVNGGQTTVSLVNSLFPFICGKRWFVETYIILIMIAPFLNLILNKLSKRNYLILLAVQLTFFSLWYSVGLSAPLLDNGYGIINFVTLYMIGGYIRLYGSTTKLLRRSKWQYALIYLVSVFATFCLSYFIYPFGYAFITVIIASVAAFLFFLKWDIGTHKAINFLGASAFDVYFVHGDANTARLLIFELLGAKYVTDSPWMLLHLPIVILAMYLLGIVAYYIRIWLFKYTVDPVIRKIPFLCREIDVAKNNEE